MRIIGGNLGGKVIPIPAEYKARPTTDFAKEGLFNILNNEYEFEGLSVLDLFAGTGAISYEFASREARQVYSIEMLPANANFIKSTASAFKLDNITVVRHNVFEFLDLCKLKFDVIFADPPYAIEGLENIPDKIFSKDILSGIGCLILEHPKEYSFKDHEYFVKERKYGNVHFSFFEKA